jgi:hypothetical protein
MKYLAQADKAARTAMMLTERIDHHRNQGKQQIVVQHTTTMNADQAVITDSVVTGKNNEASSAKLLAAVTDKPMEILDPAQKQAVPVVGEGIRNQNEHQPHAKGPRRSSVPRQTKADRKTLSCARDARLESLPDAWRARWCA